MEPTKERRPLAAGGADTETRPAYLTRRTGLYNSRELAGLGLKRAPDGALLDNRDGFYDAHPDDFLACYDRRTHVVLPRALVEELLEVLE